MWADYITTPIESRPSRPLSNFFIHPTTYKESDGACLVSPKVFVGASWNASNAIELFDKKIDTIVSMASELWARPFVNSIRYRHFPLEDDEYEYILPQLFDAAEFVHLCVINGSSGILIHCAMGRSRSVAAAAAYLIYSQQVSFVQALTHIQRQRSIASPNPGYRDQLHIYESLQKAFQNQSICGKIVAMYFSFERFTLPK